ncbi:hypothetical protein CHS0354_022879 [Potamilus streckersoni]|uniref:Poly [ADP-ribose] polymerase n=1 Tax=Potamilus streckersoni TaxID=2493646 RepID=A0AAE0S2D3_9BIVA|nr:hypothetical protein CHS0354_022879 [Potamilus streckersoni]
MLKKTVPLIYSPEKISIPSGVATPLPAGWVPWDLAHAFELVELKRDSVEFQKVESSFFASLPTHEFHIMYICRVQNMELWMAYDGQKKSMKVSLERSGQTKEVDERNLFHGTDTLDTVQGICTNNFDFRVCGKHGTVYGKGSYFARDAKYSHSYTNSSITTSDRYMFLAKVLVGEYTTGSASYAQPPDKPEATAHHLFDSFVNNVDNPSIFVVFDLKQCYPEYLICYKKLDEFPIVISSKNSTPSQITKNQPSPLPGQPIQPESSINTSSSSGEKNSVFAVPDPLQSPKPVNRAFNLLSSFSNSISSHLLSASFPYFPAQSIERSPDTSSRQTVYQRRDHGVDDIGSRATQTRHSVTDSSTKQESCCIQ